MSFSITKPFSKTAKSILTGKEVKRKQNYVIPQFGVAPAKDKEVPYTAEEAMAAIQEASDYFGADEIVRHLNWSLIVATQRRANNDLRTSTSGLDASTQARITLLTNIAKRAAEAETGTFDAKGELVVNRKSDEYVAAMRDSINANLAKPKFADLRTVFEGAEVAGETLTVDLTTPGSLNGQAIEADDDDNDAPAATETPAV